MLNSEHFHSHFPGSYTIEIGLTRNEVESIVQDAKLKVLLFEKLSPQDFHLLEEHIFSKRPEVLLSKTNDQLTPNLDLSFIQFLPSLKRLRLCDTVSLATSFNSDLLANLTDLSFFRFESKALEALNFPLKNLKSLSLEQCISKTYSASFLQKQVQLQQLHLEGPVKNIESIEKLNNLQSLTLRSVAISDFHFLKNAKQLDTLEIKLGSVKDFSFLEQLTQLKYLELWQTKGTIDLHFISKLTGLQLLHLESLAQVKALPNLDNLKQLRRLEIMNMNGLLEIEPIRTAPALQDLFFTMIKHLDVSQFVPALANPLIQNYYIYFPSEKKDKAFSLLAKEHNKTIQNMPFKPFEFI